MTIRQKLIKNGVSNLREFGYPDVNERNILTDMIYKPFFVNMLKENRGLYPSVDTEISLLLKELEPAEAPGTPSPLSDTFQPVKTPTAPTVEAGKAIL